MYHGRKKTDKPAEKTPRRTEKRGRISKQNHKYAKRILRNQTRKKRSRKPP